MVSFTALKESMAELMGTLAELKESMAGLMGTPTEGGTAQVTVGTTAAQLGPGEIRMVTIRADKNNAGTVYVGFDSSVSASTGFPLTPGDTIDIVIDDLGKIWLVADQTGQKAYLIWVR